MQDNSDQNIVDKISRDESAGIELLSHKYSGYLAKCIREADTTGLVDDREMRIRLNDIFFKFWESVKQKKYTEENKLKFYLATIANNLTMEYNRAHERKVRYFPNYEHDQLPDTEKIEDNYEFEYLEQLKSEKVKAMYDCMESSKNDNLKYLKEHALSDIKQHEIADREGISHGALRARLNALRNSLKECMENKLSGKSGNKNKSSR